MSDQRDDIHATGWDGWTGLHCAAATGHVEVCRFLLENGADKGKRANGGKTALDLARKNGHGAVVALLEAPSVAEGLLRAAEAAGLADEALPAGTRLRVEGLGEGTYERFSKNMIGANDHFVRFGTGVQTVQLKKLGPQLSLIHI